MWNKHEAHTQLLAASLLILVPCGKSFPAGSGDDGLETAQPITVSIPGKAAG